MMTNAKTRLSVFYSEGKSLHSEVVLPSAEVMSEFITAAQTGRDAYFQEAGDEGNYIAITRLGILFYKIEAVSETNIITRPGLVKP